MAASHLVVTKETRCRRQAPVRLHAPEAARRGVATDAEPSDSPCPATAQRWARLGDLPASTWALWGRMAAGRACGSRGTSHGQDDTGEQSADDRLPHGGTASRGRHRRAVVPVGARQPQAERRAARVGGEVALRTWLAPVRWVRAGDRASFFGRDDRHRPDAPGSGRSYRPRASGADGASNRAAGRDADAVQPLPSRRPASSSTRPSSVTAGPRNGVSRDHADAGRPDHGAQARQGTGSGGTRRATTRPWRDAAGQNENF
ncbi:hypothetical protein J2W79_003368 [Methylorubrum extorquens]|nr:hypothetical protein [Methylorubrum extorquens]